MQIYKTIILLVINILKQFYSDYCSTSIKNLSYFNPQVVAPDSKTLSDGSLRRYLCTISLKNKKPCCTQI